MTPKQAKEFKDLKSFRFRGETHKIKVYVRDPHKDNCWGCWYPGLRILELYTDDVTAQQLCRVLVHELFHAITGRYGAVQHVLNECPRPRRKTWCDFIEEWFVEVLSNGFMELLTENPHLRKFIFKHLNDKGAKQRKE